MVHGEEKEGKVDVYASKEPICGEVISGKRRIYSTKVTNSKLTLTAFFFGKTRLGSNRKFHELG